MLSWIINITIADFIFGVSIFSALVQTKQDEDWKVKFRKNQRMKRTSTWLKPGTKPLLKEVVEYKKRKGLL